MNSNRFTQNSIQAIHNCAKLAEEYGLVFVDVQAVFDGYLRYRHPSYLAWDRVHPNQVGAFLIARAFLDAVGFSSGGEGTENGTVL